MNIKLLALFAAGMLIASPAFALGLQEARAQGVVGEQRDGYVAAVATTPEVAALVAEVNAKRKAEYARISAENGQPVSVVGKIAAESIIGKLPKGALYKGEDGSWQKR